MKVLEFLKKTPTSFHTTKACEEVLKENGFKKLDLSEKWSLKKGGKYYVTKNQSALIGFVLGENFAFNIAVAHSDSPALKVKGNKLLDSEEGKRINVEVYGGLINYSMLDIPLKIAGRVFVQEKGKIKAELVESKFNVVIPSLAIHQNRGVNEKLEIDVQKDLLPLVGGGEDVYSLIYPKAEVLDGDLFVVPAVEPFLNGSDEQFVSAYGIDNKTSVLSVIEGLSNCKPKHIAVGCIFDNEEIGSLTKQGADSSLLSDLLKKIGYSLGHDEQDFISACEKGFMLSIDNGHAIHPAHTEKSDPANDVVLGGGIVIKHHSRYSTDGYSASVVKTMLKNAKLKYQDFYCNSDLSCGSTVGLISSSLLHINACDIGVPQLAMHSAIEMAACEDIEDMKKCCKTFFETKFDINN